MLLAVAAQHLTSAWAEKTPSPASLEKACAEIPSRLTEANNSKLSAEQRMSRLRELRDHIQAVKTQDLAKTKLPVSFWQSCLNKSVELLRAHTGSAPPAMRLHKDYLLIISELYELQDNRPQALSFIEDALKQDANDAYLRMRAARIWLEIEEEKARNLPKGSRGIPGSHNAMKSRLDDYLRPLINARRGRSPERIAALHLRAAFLESLGDLQGAQSDWNALIELEPKNIKILRKLAAFELSQGRNSSTLRFLNRIIAIDPRDLPAQKQLLKIYVEQKDYRSAKSHARKASQHFPDDQEFLGILNLKE